MKYACRLSVARECSGAMRAHSTPPLQLGQLCCSELLLRLRPGAAGLLASEKLHVLTRIRSLHVDRGSKVVPARFSKGFSAPYAL